MFWLVEVLYVTVQARFLKILGYDQAILPSSEETGMELSSLLFATKLASLCDHASSHVPNAGKAPKASSVSAPLVTSVSVVHMYNVVTGCECGECPAITPRATDPRVF
jgi:hypothetical protein